MMKAVSVVAALSFGLAAVMVSLASILLHDYSLIWTFLDLWDGVTGSTVTQP